MSDIVFILGAGASRQAGVPLMNEFLDVAGDLLASGQIADQESQTHFQRVFRAIAALQQVHSKSDLDIHNLESVFSSLEMIRLLQGFGPVTRREANQLVASMPHVIAETIEQTLQIPRSEYHLHSPEPYGAFSELIATLKERRGRRFSTAIITFNYDIALDLALERDGYDIDYGLHQASTRDRLPVLKLHGSANFYIQRERRRRTIVAASVGDLVSRLQLSPLSTAPVRVKITRIMRRRFGDVELVIVPPTWNKGPHQERIRAVWSRAAQELAEAQYIVVCGYSLPSHDLFFRYLYALGTVGEVPLRSFWVFDPDESGGVASRFIELLGPGARNRFQYRNATFEKAIPLIGDALLA